MEHKKKHSHSPSELQQNLQDIEEELKKPVNQKTFRRIFDQLSTAQQDCIKIKSKSNFASVFLSDSEHKICSLFGKVMNSLVDTEVNRIIEASFKLKKGEKKKAESLQKEIDLLKNCHRPSKEHLKHIAESEERIQQALGIFTLKEPSENNAIDELSEEVEDLFKLASLVYNKNKKDLNKTYLTLSKEAKDKFNRHLICLKTKPFEKEKSTIQALFASAFELSGIKRTSYFSSKEIDDFFAEEKKISEEDK